MNKLAQSTNVIKPLNEVVKLLNRLCISDFGLFYKKYQQTSCVDVAFKYDCDFEKVKKAILLDEHLIGHFKITKYGFSLFEGITLEYLQNQAEELIQGDD